MAVSPTETSPEPERVLFLQRSIGNAATVRLLRHSAAEIGARACTSGEAEATAQREMRSTAPKQESAVPDSGGRTAQRAVIDVQRGKVKKRRTNYRATPTPALSATEDSGQRQQGDCGDFRRVRTWHVSGGPGFILQRITRKFNVSQWNSATNAWDRMSDADIDAYTAGWGQPYATISEYWEAWIVGPRNGVTSDGVTPLKTDTFGLCSIIPQTHAATPRTNTTQGKYKITGDAWFYPSKDRTTIITPAYLTTLGLTAGGAVLANGLLSTNVDPTSAIDAEVQTGELKAAGRRVRGKAVVTWDSSPGANLTSVVTFP